MMMSENETSPRKSAFRKLALPLGVGAFAGFVSVLAIEHLLDGALFEGLSVAAEVAVLVGAFYALMGVGVGLGTLRPAVGHKLLNVEDEEELLEQRTMLLQSCLAATLWGVALIVLALGGQGGPVAAIPALVVALVAMAAGSWFAWASYKAADELMMAVNSESTMVAYLMTVAAVGGWAMAAHVGVATALEPIAIVTALYAIGILSTFVAAGRRGMLRLR